MEGACPRDGWGSGVSWYLHIVSGVERGAWCIIAETGGGARGPDLRPRGGQPRGPREVGVRA